MPRNHLLSVLAILICIIVALHFAATSFDLYWTLWWYDIIVHFLGGAFAGLLAGWLRFLSGYFGAPLIPSEFRVFCFVVLSTLVIGIGWEIFERMFGHTWSIEGYWLDTTMDVILDIGGGIAAFYFFKSNYIVREQQP